jgi:hypothetical protein
LQPAEPMAERKATFQTGGGMAQTIAAALRVSE